jgi:DNA-binding SARP family transcriptional activator
MQFRVLGPLEIETDDGLLELRGAKQRALLAMLLIHANEVVPRDLLIEGLWGAAAGERAAHSLEAQVSRLRKILRDGGRELLLTHPTGYKLSLEADQLDLFRFRGLLEQASSELEAGPPERAAATFRQALSLWRGRAFEDVAYEDFAQIEIDRLDEQRLEALEARIEADLALGRDSQLVSELEALVGRYPLRERLRGLLMLALYRSGRQAEALSVYQGARRALVEELGIEPGPVLRRLEQSILLQDPELAGVEGELAALGRPRGEERETTVTVLFAELGAQADGEMPMLGRVLHGARNELRVAVEYHGGTVQRLTGDELMAVFGVPAAHEDDVARSARAALAVRDAISALNEKLEGGLGIACRTALATGHVRVSPGSGRPELSGAVLGLVRRVAETVDPGEILIDAETAARGGAALATEAAEPRVLRGGREQLPVVRLLGVAPTDRGPVSAPMASLVGRSKELSHLRSTFDQAVEERRCGVVTVSGEAGIGKSRLVAEFGSLLGQSASVLTGRCISYGDGATFLPLTEILAQVGGAQPPELGESSTGEAFWAVRRFLERAAREQPLVLVFEDVHWAEPTLLDLIEYLGRSSSEAPLLVLCLTRPELFEERPWWAEGMPAIQLGPLSDDETLELVRNEGGGVAAELEPRIVELAAGNPLFAEQLIALLDDDEQSGGLSTVPPSIDALLSSRLDSLSDPQRAVLHRAAVVGREFWHGAVLELSSRLDEPAVGRLIAELTRNGLIEPSTSALPREDSFRFHHALIRDVAYGSIPEELRSELHERLVDWLDLQSAVPEELSGYHLEQAYRFRLGSGRADGHARRVAADAGGRLSVAGLRAAKVGDTHAASNLLSRAASLLDSDEVVRRDLLTELGLVLWRAGEVGTAEETLARSLDLAVTADDRRAEWRARIELANLHLIRTPEGGADALAALAAESISLLEELGDARTLGRIWYILAFVRGGLHCRYAESASAAERAIEYFHRSGWPVAPCVQELAASLYYGPTQVPKAVRRCRALLDEGDRGGEAHVLGFLAGLEAMEERFDSARELIQRAKTIYEELAWTVNVTTNYAPLAADIELLAGDYRAAECLLTESCGVLEEWGERAHLATQAPQLGEALFAQGRHEEALRWADVAAGCAASDDANAQFSWRALRAKALATRGGFEEAEALAQEAVSLAARTDAVAQHASVLLAYAEVLSLSGSVGAAAEAIEEATALFDRKANRAASRQARVRLRELNRC